MAIRQHRKAVGQPSHLSLNHTTVTIRCSDGVPRDRLPRPRQDEVLPEGEVNHYEEADDEAVTRWKRDIATYLVHEMGSDLRPGLRAGTQFILSKFPKDYKLYVHLKGKKEDPRKDYYLYGSKWVHKFRSPEEFVLHAKWLAFQGPILNGKPLCVCKYCGKTDQSEIGEYLYKKVGFDESLHYQSGRPLKRKRAEPEKPIMFKDYTMQQHTMQLDDVKPHLQTIEIKEEEF